MTGAPVPEASPRLGPAANYPGLGITPLLVAAVLTAAVLQRALHDGLEMMLFARAMLLATPAVRRWLEGRGQLHPQPRLVGALELASCLWLFHYPPRTWGHLLAAVAVLLPLLMPPPPSRGARAAERGLVVGAGALLVVALAIKVPLEAPTPWLLCGTWAVSVVLVGLRSIEEAVRATSVANLLLAAVLVHGYDVPGPVQPASALLLLSALGIAATWRDAIRGPSRLVRLRLALTTFGVLLALGIVEGVGQLHAIARGPSYVQLSLQPDLHRGWRHRPGVTFRWAGPHWYAQEFSRTITINANGDRDRPRALDKPPGCRRIAVLGDSYVEAEQVELESMATQVLERRLQAHTPSSAVEVLNFGVSSYGVGQLYATYLHHVRQFGADDVVVFVAPFHMLRTVETEDWGAFPDTKSRRLSIRPRFQLEAGKLVAFPIRDMAEFVRLHEERVLPYAGRESSAVRGREWFLGDVARLVRLRFSGEKLGIPTDRRVPDGPTLALNLAILEALGRAVREDGGRLIVADASTYYAPTSGDVSKALQALCARNGAVHLDLASHLREAEAQVAIRWPIDGHWNEEGNRVFADAMFEALTRP